jgi:hypothetical protein
VREPMGAGRHARNRAQRGARVVAAVGGVTTVAAGLWAFFAPRSFADFAKFPPYNQHLIHDIGAFEIGIGAALLLALVFRDGLLVALGGGAAAAVMHFISHVIDRDLGGRSLDPWLFGILAVVIGLAAFGRYRTEG